MSFNPPPSKPLFGVPRLHYKVDKMIADGKIQPKPTSSQSQPKPTSSQIQPKSNPNTFQVQPKPEAGGESTTTYAQGVGFISDDDFSLNKMKSKMDFSKKTNKLKDPLAPKRPPSSFFLFSKEERPKVVEMLGNSQLGPVAAELGKRWAELKPEEKTKWEAMGKEMKAKYDEDKANYTPSEEFLVAARNEKQQAKQEMSGDMAKTVDKMAPYFSHLLSTWTKVAITRPDLTAQEVQTEVWQQWVSQNKKGKVVKVKPVKKVKDPNAPKRALSAYMNFLNENRAELIKENPTMTYSEVLAEAGKKWKSLDEGARAPFVAEAKKKSEEYHQEMKKYKGL